MEATVVWVGQTRTEGAKVYIMQGYSPTIISTPFVDRLLQNDPLTLVQAFASTHFGHPLYVLTLVTTGITLVYDFLMKDWYIWTTLSSGNAVVITSLSVLPLNTATYARVIASTAPNPHGMKDGDPIQVQNVAQAQYNVSGNATVIDQFTFQYTINQPGDPQTVGLLRTYSTSTYGTVAAANLANSESGAIGSTVYGQNAADGNIYVLTYNTASDFNAPIDFTVVTPVWDGGIMGEKFVTRASVVGDQTASKMLVRRTTTDYQTWSLYRPVNMNSQWPFIPTLGKINRAAFQVRHTDFTPQRVEAIELEFEVGV